MDETEAQKKDEPEVAPPAETKPPENSETQAAATTTPTKVEEEIEEQHPPENPVVQGEDKLAEWQTRRDADIDGLLAWRKSVEERENEKAEHRQTIESKTKEKDKEHGVQKQSKESGGGGSETKSRKLRVLRRHK